MALRGILVLTKIHVEYGEGANSVGTAVGNTFISNNGKYSSGGLNFSSQQNQSAYMVFENENSSLFRLENESEMSLLFWVKPAKADDTQDKKSSQSKMVAKIIILKLLRRTSLMAIYQLQALTHQVILVMHFQKQEIIN